MAVLGAADGPPGQPPAAFGRDGNGREGHRRALTVVAVIIASALAAYVGIAVGDSIQGGGTDIAGSVETLPTQAPGVRQVACGTAPIAMDQGTLAAIAFDPTALPDYQIAEAVVRPVSSSASSQSVKATAQRDLSVLFEAFSIGGIAGRVDEYELAVTFARGQDRTIAQCRILVAALPPTATPTLIPTVAPTDTPTPVPTPTPVVFPTAPPPPPPTALPTDTPSPATSTPEPATGTPALTSTPAGTITPTPTGTPVTGTPTATGTPPTATATP
jgi:hypothetical protein